MQLVQENSVLQALPWLTQKIKGCGVSWAAGGLQDDWETSSLNLVAATVGDNGLFFMQPHICLS